MIYFLLGLLTAGIALAAALYVAWRVACEVWEALTRG